MSDALKEELKALELKLLDSEARKSVKMLDKIISDDFLEITPSGEVCNKKEIIDFLPTSTAEFTTKDFRVKKISESIAQLFYESAVTGSKDEPPEQALRSSIWRRNDVGQWQIVFHQGTKL